MITWIAVERTTHKNIFASPNKQTVAREIINYLKPCYTAEEWNEYLKEDNFNSDEEFIGSIVAGLDTGLSKFDIAIDKFVED